MFNAGMAINGYDPGEPRWNWQDRAVLSVLEEHNPDVVSLSDLRTLYRNETNINQEETLKKHIKELTRKGPFESDGMQRWRYTG